MPVRGTRTTTQIVSDWVSFDTDERRQPDGCVAVGQNA